MYYSLSHNAPTYSAFTVHQLMYHVVHQLVIFMGQPPDSLQRLNWEESRGSATEGARGPLYSGPPPEVEDFHASPLPPLVHAKEGDVKGRSDALP